MSDNIPPTKQRLRTRWREGCTPPPVLAPEGSHQQEQLETPQRSAVFAVLYFCEKMGYYCTLNDIERLFRIPTTTSSRILQSKRARRLQNDPYEPDSRGRPRKLTNSDAQAISDYIQSLPHCTDKNKPWEDLAYGAGVTAHPEAEENSQNRISSHTIQRRVTAVTGMKTFKAAIKEELSQRIKDERVTYCTLYLQLRPRGLDWRNVLWGDEIHNSSGPVHVSTIKRLPGTRFLPENIQYEKHARHDQEEEAIQKFHFFCVVGYNFKWCTEYNASNSNGKMNTETYINTILPKLKEQILGRELVLWQDRDSAHVSRATLSWMDRNGMDYINSSTKSPDLSIMETWVHSIRRRFTARRVATAEAGVKRFYRVIEELDQERINRSIDLYPKRLRECKNLYRGAMTKY